LLNRKQMGRSKARGKVMKIVIGNSRHIFFSPFDLPHYFVYDLYIVFVVV